MSDNVEYFNEFERKTLITQLTDYEIEFEDMGDINALTTRIKARRKDKDKYFFYHPYTLNSQGIAFKKEIKTIMNSIIQNDKWDDLQKSEVKKI